ncbi:MAG: transcription termination/antitermination protein NusA [Clostridia bacterium]|nr:transcription termination/antitermination protein NusA [Clostridia bacterium]
MKNENTNFYEALEELGKAYGIPKDKLNEKIQQALLSAYKKEKKGMENLNVVINDEKRTVKVYQQKTVVQIQQKKVVSEVLDPQTEISLEDAQKIRRTIKPGIFLDIVRSKQVVEDVENTETEISVEDAQKINRGYKLGDTVNFVLNPESEVSCDEVNRKYTVGDKIDVELKMKDFSRDGAMSARGVIIQMVREADRERLAKEYENKREEIVTATVVKVDPQTGNATVDTGTSEAVLLKSEQIPGETFEVGDRIKVFIMEVNKPEPKSTNEKSDRKTSRVPIVTLSRTHPGLVKRLFELEIPEIEKGTVVIKDISREAGSRTKIAVESRDPNVDPIGACIGNKSSRLSNILNELGGEKIDIIKYSENPAEYISAALSPATIRSVTLDGERSCRVIVDPGQLSLAIGKEGQNARLAARLTKYKIDIKTE